MPISTQLTRLARNVGAINADTNAIFEALRAKGVDVPANAQLSDVAEMIESIEVPITSVEIGGRSYPVVRIGNQLWMAENLDWKFSGCTFLTNSSTSSHNCCAYYGNNSTQPYQNYGLSYDYYACRTLYESNLLPSGWRVPVRSDFESLISIVEDDASKIKSNSGWISNPGSDDLGFCAYPTGERRNDGNWYQYGEVTGFWFYKPNQSGAGSDQAYLKYDSNVITIRGVNIENFYPIRLVRDL